ASGGAVAGEAPHAPRVRMSKHPRTRIALSVMPPFPASELRSILRSVGRLGVCAMLALAAGCGGGGGDAAAPTATHLSPNPPGGGGSATVTGFTPSSATPGAVVTISGTGLATVTSARVGGGSASFRIVSDTRVEGSVRSGARTARMDFGVEGAVLLSANVLTVVAVPTITSVTPTTVSP